MILKHRAELAGRVKLQISGGGRGTIDIPWFDNMVLDQGLRILLTHGGASGTVSHNYIGVGSSSQPVSRFDVGLISPVRFQSAYRANTGWDAEGGFGWTRFACTFGRGQAAGNLSEVSSGNASNNTSIVCRALIKDGEGNPTTITILPDEILKVTWELRRWWTVMPDHVVEYDDGDGGIASTTVSYLPIESMSKAIGALGCAGETGFGGSLVSDFVAERSIFFSETQGNPSISVIGTPNDSGYNLTIPYQPNYTTFDPPIPKTNEFTVKIVWQVALTRREP